MGRHTEYKKKNRKNNQSFLILVCSLIFIGIILLVILFANSFNKSKKNSELSSDKTSSVTSKEDVTSDLSSIESNEPVSSVESSSKQEVSSSVLSNTSSKTESKKPESDTSSTLKTLDPDLSKLILVNGENPLPADYNYSGNLKIIEDKYLCGWRNQIDKDVLPYLTSMIEAAWDDGVELYVLSPYRSYDTQVGLFEKEVQKWINTGMDRESAENKASTIVARPGTSEHHTGLAVDFNSVEDSFESTKMFKWLDNNAHNYGFILRYTEDKQPITGVIHESWHWRFIGINAAKKYKACGNICLEEFLEQY